MPPVNGQTSREAATAAIDSWFEGHHRILENYIRLRFGFYDLAKDVTQRTYERVRGASPSCEGEELRRYVFKVASNLAIDLLRHGRRHDVRRRAVVESEEQSKGTEEEILEEEERALTAEQIQRLPGYLQELPEAYRTAVAEYNIRGATQREIAETLGVSERMVNNYISYATVYCRLRLDGLSKEDAWKQRKVRL